MLYGHPKDCCTMSRAATIQDSPFQIGEERHTSAGNVFRLVRWSGSDHVMVERVSHDGTPNEDWDKGMLYRWHICQWESIPLVGEQSEDPSFGTFLPTGVQL